MAQKQESTSVRKMTVKSICGPVDLEKLIKSKKLALMDLWGIASRTKGITTDYGSAVRFIGQFRAVNLDTGELFTSTRLYLPSALEEELQAAMSGAESAEFGLRIFVIYDKSNTGMPYYYDAESLVKPANTDALAALEEKVLAARKVLPSPKKVLA